MQACDDTFSLLLARYCPMVQVVGELLLENTAECGEASFSRATKWVQASTNTAVEPCIQGGTDGRPWKEERHRNVGSVWLCRGGGGLKAYVWVCA